VPVTYTIISSGTRTYATHSETAFQVAGFKFNDKKILKLEGVGIHPWWNSLWAILTGQFDHLDIWAGIKTPGWLPNFLGPIKTFAGFVWGHGEEENVATALEWLKNQIGVNPNETDIILALAGHSRGGMQSIKIAEAVEKFQQAYNMNRTSTDQINISVNMLMTSPELGVERFFGRASADSMYYPANVASVIEVGAGQETNPFFTGIASNEIKCRSSKTRRTAFLINETHSNMQRGQSAGKKFIQNLTDYFLLANGAETIQSYAPKNKQLLQDYLGQQKEINHIIEKRPAVVRFFDFMGNKLKRFTFKRKVVAAKTSDDADAQSKEIKTNDDLHDFLGQFIHSDIEPSKKTLYPPCHSKAIAKISAITHPVNGHDISIANKKSYFSIIKRHFFRIKREQLESEALQYVTAFIEDPNNILRRKWEVDNSRHNFIDLLRCFATLYPGTRPIIKAFFERTGNQELLLKISGNKTFFIPLHHQEEELFTLHVKTLTIDELKVQQQPVDDFFLENVPSGVNLSEKVTFTDEDIVGIYQYFILERAKTTTSERLEKFALDALEYVEKLHNNKAKKESPALAKIILFFENFYPNTRGLTSAIRREIPDIKNFDKHLQNESYGENFRIDLQSTFSFSGGSEKPVLGFVRPCGENVACFSVPGKHDEYVDVDEKGIILAKKRTYAELDASFKRGLNSDEKLGYINRLVHYFDKKHHHADYHEQLKKEAIVFIIQLTKEYNINHPHFLRRPRDWFQSSMGLTRSYYECLLFFAAEFGAEKMDSSDKTIAECINEKTEKPADKDAKHDRFMSYGNEPPLYLYRQRRFQQCTTPKTSNDKLDFRAIRLK